MLQTVIAQKMALAGKKIKRFGSAIKCMFYLELLVVRYICA